MFLFIYKAIRMVLNALRGSNSPLQVGLGIALGMLIGIIPKDSLFAYFFALLIFATNINLLATSLSAFAFMWIGSFLDPISHRVGYFILMQPNLQTSFLWLYEQPVVPWTRFNNTVVLGSLVIGLIAFYPVYLAGRVAFVRLAPRFNSVMVRFWIYRVLVGRKKLTELASTDP